MTLKIRRLDPVADLELFERCYSWLLDSPRWRLETEGVFGTLDRDEYLAAAHNPGRVDIGIFDGELVAKVALHLTAKNTYEVSLEADRCANTQLIIQAGCLVRDQLFGRYGAELAYVWIPTRHSSVQRIIKAIGFQADNVTMLHGEYRGRLIEWLLFSLKASYVEQKQTATADHAGPEPVLQRHQHLRLSDAA